MTILAIGKRHDRTLEAAVERYQVRLKKPYSAKWILLPHSLRSGAQAVQEESEQLMKHLSDRDFVVLLDERGIILDSSSLSINLEEALATGRHVVFIIGGAYGLNEALRVRANLVWSLSRLVFPHQLVRLMLIEQVYRAQTIARGEPYHHE